MFDNIYEIELEVYHQNRLINKQNIQAPKEMIMINFVQMMNQIGNDSRPMCIKMIRPITIWSKIEQKQKTLNNELEFSNNAMIAWQDSKRR